MNKTVLITGASSGIGLELSKLFARNNYNLLIVSKNEENIEKAKSIIRRENTKIEIYSIAKDLSKTSAPQEIFEYTLKNSIQVDILVNNAGIQVYGNFHDANIDDILNLMNVNMLAMTKLTRLFVDGMTAVDTMNHFFLNKEVIIAGSTYWNMVYGKDIGDVLNDVEGINNMKNLGQNMAWILSQINTVK